MTTFNDRKDSFEKKFAHDEELRFKAMARRNKRLGLWVAGLLGQIGEGLNSPTLIDVGRRTSWALPFEALYQDGLARISSESLGLTGFVLQLGPFGGAQDAGAALVPWTLAYLGVVALVAVVAFRRRDL